MSAFPFENPNSYVYSMGCHVEGVVDTSAGWEAEITTRISKSRGTFAKVQHVWGARRMGVRLRMQCFRACAAVWL
jgi:hypothetical protein